MRRRSTAARALVLMLVATLLAGCSGSQPAQPALQLDRTTAPIDAVLPISVVGLADGQPVTLKVETVDRAGEPWSSSATFNADSFGSVRLASASPIAGDYHGRQPMGLFTSMRSRSAKALPFYLPPEPTQTATVTATAGSWSASRTITRELTAAGLTVVDERPADDGFYGEFYSLRGLPDFRPAVVVFGGAEGGVYFSSLTARMLAVHGYPSLALAYFGAPGLPQTLEKVPLEYFTRALTWIRQQPGVDPKRVLTYGWSRGSEAALLLGAHFPDLVNGVVALAPSDVANGPAWTLGGQPVPYTNQRNEPHPTDNPTAVIRVDQIAGPLFMVCGGADQVWTSCNYATAIEAQLEAAVKPYPHTLLSFPNAGHGLSDLVPYILAGRTGTLDGSSSDANDLARAQAWPRLLAFLSGLHR